MTGFYVVRFGAAGRGIWWIEIGFYNEILGVIRNGKGSAAREDYRVECAKA